MLLGGAAQEEGQARHRHFGAEERRDGEVGTRVVELGGGGGGGSARGGALMPPPIVIWRHMPPTPSSPRRVMHGARVCSTPTKGASVAAARSWFVQANKLGGAAW